MPLPTRHLAALALAAILAGCGPDYSPNTYSASAVQQAAKVEQATVVGVRPVAVSASGAVGAATGAAAGGIAGAQAPGGNVGAALGAVGGGLVGGLIGTGVEHAAGDTNAWEYIVRKANGDLLSVTQKDATPLPLGTKVLLIAGSQARIVRDYTAPADAPKQAATAQAATSSSASSVSSVAPPSMPATSSASAQTASPRPQAVTAVPLAPPPPHAGTLDPPLAPAVPPPPLAPNQ